MKSPYLRSLLIAALVTLALIAFHPSSFGQTNPIPPQLQNQLPVGMPPISDTGLSFTNANYKAAAGTELLSGGSGGTLSYVQADADLIHTKAVDFGLGMESAQSSTGNGFHGLGVDVELIKNFPNWQLTFKLGGSRNFDTNVGWFADFGFDVNYNLAAGTGLSFLGNGKGYFTYVGAGVNWNTKDFKLWTSSNPTDVEKDFRIYAGVAF